MFRGWHVLCSSVTLHLMFDTDWVALTKLEACWLGSLVGHQGPGNLLFPFPSAWTTDIQTSYFYITVGDWIWVFMPMRQTLCQLSHFPGPMFAVSFIELSSSWNSKSSKGYRDDCECTNTTKYQQRHCKASSVLFDCLDGITMEGHKQMIFEWKKQISGMREVGKVQVMGTTELPWRRMWLLSSLVTGVWGRRWHIAPVLKGTSSREMKLACILSVKEGHWKVESRREITRVLSLKRWFWMLTGQEIQGKSLNALSKSGRQHRLRGQ